MGSTPFWDAVTADQQTAPGYEGATYQINAWDVVKLADVTLPGLAEIMPGCRAKRRVDNRKAQGSDGDVKTSHGYDPGPIEIKIHIWTPQQLALLEDLIAKIWPRKLSISNAAAAFLAPTISPQLPALLGADSDPAALAYNISHPSLSYIGISQIFIVGINPLVDSSRVKGGKMLGIFGTEFLPMSPATKNVTKSHKAAKSKTAPVIDQFTPPINQSLPPADPVNYTPSNSGPSQSLPTDNQSVYGP